MLTGLTETLWRAFRPLFLAAIVSFSLAVYWLDSPAMMTGSSTGRQTAVSPPANETPPPTGPAYGVNHISYPAAQPISEQRYQHGLSTGAAWNRWPMYWHDIEQQPGVFAWAYQDTAVIADVAHGLQLNAILLGTPGFYRTESSAADSPTAAFQPNHPTSAFTLDAIQSGVPLGLYEPVFADGTDLPGPGKQINPANVWARFVATAVARYKPGGLIAQQQGWSTGVGVTHWEMWNEPDLIHFWDGSPADYARLLKVGFLAAKQSDPQAQVIFGGLAVVYSPNDIPYLTEILNLYDQDPLAAEFAYFHDVLALHNYSYAYRSWRAVYIAQRRLEVRQLEKPIWLNETGVPVWDDYPGPVCDPNSPFRATMSEQADFIIQNALYGAYAGVDNLFFFQLYDDCGNQPGGTNFPPVQSCTGNDPGGDAFGLFRNVNDSSVAQCYWEHPDGGTPRPGLAAMQLLTSHFHGVTPLWRQRPGGTQEWLAFYRPESKARIVGLWALREEEETAVITTTNQAQTALLLHPTGITETISATNGVFTLTLPAATNRNTPTDQPINPIGGRPFLLIEVDDVPPTVAASAPPLAAGVVQVAWAGQDFGSGMAGYDVTVAVDEGAPVDWLMGTTAVSGLYPIPMGYRYTFTVYGWDQAGNRSGGTAVTVLAPVLDQHVYLPLINK